MLYIGVLARRPGHDLFIQLVINILDVPWARKGSWHETTKSHPDPPHSCLSNYPVESNELFK